MLHVLGVTAADTPVPAALEEHSGMAPRLVQEGGLAAIVSDDPTDRVVGRAELLAHAHALESFAEHATVIPFKFGIALEDDAEVRQRVLTEQRETLTELLGFFEGLQQVTVQAFLDEESGLREVLRQRPDLAAARDVALRPAGGLDVKVEYGRAIAVASDEVRAQENAALLEVLSPLALAVSEAGPGGEFEVLHAAFLVERARRAEFDRAVGRLRDDNDGRLHLRYVGPQPPYSFLEAARNGELAWD